MYIIYYYYFFWGGGGGILKMLFACKFFKLSMVSDEKIHRAFRIHKTL